MAVYIFASTYCHFFFFFSSRRRHTRSDRDWSSDVCSSDLLHRPAAERRGEQSADDQCEQFLPRRGAELDEEGSRRRDGDEEFRRVDRADRHARSEEHMSELQSRSDLVCRLLLEKKKQ